jgi:hypothetical protein
LSVTRRPSTKRDSTPSFLSIAPICGPAAVTTIGLMPTALSSTMSCAKSLRGVGIAHRVAAVLDHETAPAIALEIGQRLDQRFRLGEHLLVVGRGHGGGQ